MQTGMLAAPSQRSGGSGFKTTGSLPWCEKASQAFIIAMWEPCASPRQDLNTGSAFSWLQRPLCPKVMRRWRFRQENLGVCFLYGKDSSPDLFGMDAHKACVAAWQERGWTPSGWFLERYNCPRYTVPDEKGNVILDYCAYLLPISKE